MPRRRGAVQDFEKLGVFYLGREFDLKKKALKENLVLYDSRDLVTHAVCVGMTGSGKTGLGIGLLEEAVIDNIPAIVVDPKGDLANLLLTFPDLKEGDFLPWINEEEAQRKGISPQEYAAKQAALWKKGLAEWGQDGGRIRKLRGAAGEAAGQLRGARLGPGLPSFLNLLGPSADPIQSREHILLSTILDSAWKQGKDLDLAGFIQAIQSPPMSRIGA